MEYKVIKVVQRNLLLGLMLFSASSFVQAQSDLKIAVLDVQRAMFESAAAQVVDQELQELTADDQKKISDIETKAQSLDQQLQQDSAILSEAETRKIVDEISELQVQFQYLVEKLQQTVSTRREQFAQTYQDTVLQAVVKVVEEGGYDLVVHRDAIIHVSSDSGLDITPLVIQKLNEM